MSSKVYIQADVIGWLKEDAVLQEVGNGFQVCKFCVKAQKYNRQTKQKDMVFMDCDLWGKRAEKMRQMLRKDKYVSVKGTIDTFKYPTINVQDVTLLSQAQEKKEEAPPPNDAPPPVDYQKVEDLF